MAYCILYSPALSSTNCVPFQTNNFWDRPFTKVTLPTQASWIHPLEISRMFHRILDFARHRSSRFDVGCHRLGRYSPFPKTSLGCPYFLGSLDSTANSTLLSRIMVSTLFNHGRCRPHHNLWHDGTASVRFELGQLGCCDTEPFYTQNLYKTILVGGLWWSQSVHIIISCPWIYPSKCHGIQQMYANLSTQTKPHGI